VGRRISRRYSKMAQKQPNPAAEPRRVERGQWFSRHLPNAEARAAGKQWSSMG